jgi:hypothetical protein
MKFGTLVVQTLKFLKMSQFITLKSIAFRWRHFKSQYLLCPTLTCSTGRICLGIDSINRQIRSCGILPHSCSWACCSSCRVCGTGWLACNTARTHQQPKIATSGYFTRETGPWQQEKQHQISQVSDEYRQSQKQSPWKRLTRQTSLLWNTEINITLLWNLAHWLFRP